MKKQDGGLFHRICSGRALALRPARRDIFQLVAGHRVRAASLGQDIGLLAGLLSARPQLPHRMAHAVPLRAAMLLKENRPRPTFCAGAP